MLAKTTRLGLMTWTRGSVGSCAKMPEHLVLTILRKKSNFQMWVSLLSAVQSPKHTRLYGLKVPAPICNICLGVKILDPTTKALQVCWFWIKVEFNFRNMVKKDRTNPGCTLRKRLGMNCKSLGLWCTSCMTCTQWSSLFLCLKAKTRLKIFRDEQPLPESHIKKSGTSPVPGLSNSLLRHHHSGGNLFWVQVSLHPLRMCPPCIHPSRFHQKQSQLSGELHADGADRMHWQSRYGACKSQYHGLHNRNEKPALIPTNSC